MLVERDIHVQAGLSGEVGVRAQDRVRVWRVEQQHLDRARAVNRGIERRIRTKQGFSDDLVVQNDLLALKHQRALNVFQQQAGGLLAHPVARGAWCAELRYS